MPKIDHIGTDNIVCPYCGYKHDLDEPFNDGERTCRKCHRCFYCKIEYSASFDTEKLEDYLKQKLIENQGRLQSWIEYIETYGDKDDFCKTAINNIKQINFEITEKLKQLAEAENERKTK